MFNEHLLKQVAARLQARHETIAVAESVTAGLLQAAFAAMENATVFFQGGMTVYNITQKVKHLQVNPITAIRCNAVAEEIAAQMAMGILHHFGSHWGIGITGYAAPLPGHEDQQLYACCAIVNKPGMLSTFTLQTGIAEPLQVQLFYVDGIMQKLSALTEA